MKDFIKAAVTVIIFCAMILGFGYQLSCQIPNTPKEHSYSPR